MLFPSSGMIYSVDTCKVEGAGCQVLYWLIIVLDDLKLENV